MSKEPEGVLRREEGRGETARGRDEFVYAEQRFVCCVELAQEESKTGGREIMYSEF